MKRLYLGTLFILPILLLSGCAPSVYYVKPSDWITKANRDSTIASYSKYFKGWKIFLDPGHGGEDRVSHGPANDVIEADVNLHVASYLRDYLEAAGATVFMSRTKDTTVQLRDRSTIANKSGADIFISIHHNAPGGNDLFINYTSTWYHSVEGDPSYYPCNHDIAKYIQRDLAYAMGNSGPAFFSFDGTLSDFIIYPNSGFSVLRLAEIPAVLLECAFFTSAYEEQRLKLEEFNQIQAWGIFRGLGKYLKAGVPKLELISPVAAQGDVLSTSDFRPTIKVQVADPSGIDASSLVMRIDGKKVICDFDTSGGTITHAPPEDMSKRDHTVEVIVRNMNGNSSFPFKKVFKVNPPAASIKVDIYPRVVPPDGKSLALVSAAILDVKGNPVADGTPVYFSATAGTIGPSAYTSNGKASVYLRSSQSKDIGLVTAMSGEVSLTDTVVFGATENRYLTGVVSSSLTKKSIEDAEIVLGTDKSKALLSQSSFATDNEGRYIISEKLGDSTELTAMKDGYWGKKVKLALTEATNETNFTLDPVARGSLFGKTYVIDPRYSGAQRSEVSDSGITASQVNLGVSQYLERLLNASGANVHLVTATDSSIAWDLRARGTRRFRDGIYIHINASDKSGKAGISVYRNPRNQKLASNILTMLNQTTVVDTTGVILSEGGIPGTVPVGALLLALPSVRSNFYQLEMLTHDECRIAWGIYRGILAYEGYDTTNARTVRIRVTTPDGKAAPNREVILDNALIAVTDSWGVVTFYDVIGGDCRAEILDQGDYLIVVE